jgi:hypothetical protein
MGNKLKDKTDSELFDLFIQYSVDERITVDKEKGSVCIPAEMHKDILGLRKEFDRRKINTRDPATQEKIGRAFVLYQTRAN